MTKPEVNCHEAQYWSAATPAVHKCDYEALAAENAELRTALAATDKLASEAAQRNEELHSAVTEAVQLISGDLVGIEWKQACAAFLKRARSAIQSQQAKP